MTRRRTVGVVYAGERKTPRVYMAKDGRGSGQGSLVDPAGT